MCVQTFIICTACVSMSFIIVNISLRRLQAFSHVSPSTCVHTYCIYKWCANHDHSQQPKVLHRLAEHQPQMLQSDFYGFTQGCTLFLRSHKVQEEVLIKETTNHKWMAWKTAPGNHTQKGPKTLKSVAFYILCYLLFMSACIYCVYVCVHMHVCVRLM